MSRQTQELLFADAAADEPVRDETSSTFVKNMALPVHRWFRYSAGFSAAWAESVIRSHSAAKATRVLDPFAGSATTLLAAENAGVPSCGIEAHPFVCRIALAKLARRSDPEHYRRRIGALRKAAPSYQPELDRYPKLIRACYDDRTLSELDALRQAYEALRDESSASELTWLTLVAILRQVSKAGTAQWQYILPKKQKRAPQAVNAAFEKCWRMIYRDMQGCSDLKAPAASFYRGDARTCTSVEEGGANLVITSPPYPNNYDYADATRLEMSFFGEVSGWGDLQGKVRRHLVRSCSQHVPERAVDLEATLEASELSPISSELSAICAELSTVRESKGGRKTYHLMIASYFRDLAQVWLALRRVTASPSVVCFVIGDSAPYGVYVPVIPWLGKLAMAAGFKSWRFEKTRDRNVKWKNRKHRVPLQEGRLWVEG